MNATQCPKGWIEVKPGMYMPGPELQKEIDGWRKHNKKVLKHGKV